MTDPGHQRVYILSLDASVQIASHEKGPLYALFVYNHAKEIPQVIMEHIGEQVRTGLPEALLRDPIGGTAVMHSHNTLPAMAQKYRQPI